VRGSSASGTPRILGGPRRPTGRPTFLSPVNEDVMAVTESSRFAQCGETARLGSYLGTVTSKRSGPLLAATSVGDGGRLPRSLAGRGSLADRPQRNSPSTYVGRPLREARAARCTTSAAAPLHAALDRTPIGRGNLPFVNAPLAAAVALPVSLAQPPRPRTGFWSSSSARWVGAVRGPVRAAPGRRPCHRSPWSRRSGLGALACLGTLATLLPGQWDGSPPLAVALAYACLRGDGRRPPAPSWR